MFVSIIMQSLPWGMPFGLNALLLHFDLETALRHYVRFMQQRPTICLSVTVTDRTTKYGSARATFEQIFSVHPKVCR
ncbi:MAG: hypothetical protein VB125_05565, partial [Burkholderia sp.]